MASSALRTAAASLRAWALASWPSSDSMAVRSWPTVASARASASGLERFHWASSARLTASSTLRRPCSSWSLDSRGTGPACSQRSWIERRADLAGAPVGHRQQRLRLDQQLLLGGGVDAELGLLGREHLRAGREELVLGAAEPLPQLGLVVPAGPAGFLPLPHQLAVGAGRPGPVGGVGQRLGLRDELLLLGPDRVPLGLERGEVGLAPLGERVPRGRQALPQHRLDRPVGVRGGLPLLEQLGHPLAALLPVRGLGRDALRLVDDALLDPAGLGPRLLAGGLDLLPALVDDAGQRLEAGLERVEVADRVRVRHGRQQPLHGCLGLGGGDLGRLHALLEQRDLGLEGGELAPEEHECLFRAARRPRADHPLAIGGAHVDRPVGVYPTPGIVGGGHGEPPGSPAAPGVCRGEM